MLGNNAHPQHSVSTFEAGCISILNRDSASIIEPPQPAKKEEFVWPDADGAERVNQLHNNR